MKLTPAQRRVLGQMRNGMYLLATPGHTYSKWRLIGSAIYFDENSRICNELLRLGLIANIPIGRSWKHRFEITDLGRSLVIDAPKTSNREEGGNS